MREKKTLRQIWKDVKCAIGWHDEFTWDYIAGYKNIRIANCHNCDYRHEEPITSYTVGADIELDEYLREVRRV